ncbi:MAG: TetR family transcriptional regulator [Nitrospira sp. CR2.1]|nr:TetR family transcriptional regulator [Nitrospira sp. CR2.1]
MKQTDTKTAILDAAQDLIQRVGVNAMSYQHISEAVGIRKASIHHHFPTKEQLLDELIARYSRHFLGLVDDIMNSRVGPATKLRRYAALFEATLSEGQGDKACLCGMLSAEVEALGSRAVAGLRRFSRENERRVAQVLEEGRRRGELIFEGHARVLATLVFQLLEGSMLMARADGGPKRFRAVIGQMMTLLR